MSRVEALEAISAHNQDRRLAARTWKAGGGKVVGHLGGGTPDALIMAAGFMPYQLTGDPQADLGTLDWALYPIFNKQQAVRGLIELEWVNTVIAQLFSGRFDFVDYLVIPCFRKEVSQINAHLRDARIAYPELILPEVYLLDRAMQPNYAASTFNRAAILDFKTVLERWSGAEINNERLQAAIGECAAHRAGLEALLQLQKQQPAGLRGVEALEVLITSTLMPKRDHLRLIEAIMNAPASRRVPEGVRVLLSGSPQDHTALHHMVEDLGGVVVADDHAWGERLLGPAFDPDLTPFGLIADRYHRTPPSLTMPIEDEGRRCAALAVAAKADVAIIYVHNHDDLQLFTTPDQIAAIKALGLPVLYLAQQPYQPLEMIRTQLGGFLSQAAATQYNSPAGAV